MGERRNGVLAVAALAAGVVAIGLIVLGIWLRHWTGGGDGPRYAEPSWWAGLGSQLLGYLALGKGGLKAALAVLLGASAVVAWIRGRRTKDSRTEGQKAE